MKKLFMIQTNESSNTDSSKINKIDPKSDEIQFHTNNTNILKSQWFFAYLCIVSTTSLCSEQPSQKRKLGSGLCHIDSHRTKTNEHFCGTSSSSDQRDCEFYGTLSHHKCIPTRTSCQENTVKPPDKE